MAKYGDHAQFFACGPYTFMWVDNGLPENYEDLRSHAALVDDFDLHLQGERACTLAVFHDNAERPFMAAFQSNAGWPFLIVSQVYPDRQIPRYSALMYVSEANLLFVGVPDRALAYNLEEPARMWIEVDIGDFWGWHRRHDLVLMLAEFAFKAYDLSGKQIWEAYVEPPWGYSLTNDAVHLAVYNRPSSVFPLHSGPK